MQVLVIGGGGREHALVWKIKQSQKVKKIFCAPGNAGTREIAENISIATDDVKGLLEFALKMKIGLTVVGPEQPLVMGIVDLFEKNGLRIFGPNARAAKLEGSKSFSKDIMNKYVNVEDLLSEKTIDLETTNKLVGIYIPSKELFIDSIGDNNIFLIRNRFNGN